MTITWTWHDVFVQSLGLASFAIFMAAYQIKDTRRTQLLFAPGNILYGVQYFLLGSQSATLMMFSAAARDLVGAYASDRVLKVASVIHLIVVWTGIAILAHSWQEGLMGIASTISTAAALFRNDFYKFRFLLMGRQVMMILFNVWIQSYAGVAHLSFTFLSNVYGTYRHSRKPKKGDKNYPDE